MCGKKSNLLFLLILGALILQLVFPVSAGDSCSTDEESLGTVLIATVEGDAHTFNKDSIASVFEENGFNVINLGDNISAEGFVANATENDVDFVFSSACMSTTMIHQIQIEEHLKATGIRDKVVTGVVGSLVTQDWADQIGADIYASDAEDAVSKAKSAMNRKILKGQTSANESTSCGNNHR